MAPPVEERVSFLIHKVNARLAQIVNREFRAADLDLFSSRILVFLLEREEMRVGELVESMVLPQSTISHQLQRLEKKKLIRRRRTKEDNRSVSVVLTPFGKEVALRCNHLSLNVYNALTAQFTEAELSSLRAQLRRMFEALGEIEAADPTERQLTEHISGARKA
jgi:DNA-binding MarR family transcriptional regulator